MSIHLPPGLTLVALDDVDSTNAEARRQVAAGAGSGLVVWARRQTAGRGRRGRIWQSPPGNLYASFVLPATADPAHTAQLSFAAALAVRDAARQALPGDVDVRCKWPNDVLLAGRKCCGILLEAVTAGSRVDKVIVGIGLNVAWSPAEADYPSTSLVEAGAVGLTEETALELLAPRVAYWAEVWRTGGFIALREAWLASAVGVGGAVEVRLSDRTLTGTFEDLDESGALVLRMADGTAQTITAGDVFFGRSAS